MCEINAIPYVRHVAIMHNKLVDAIGSLNSSLTLQVRNEMKWNYLFIVIIYFVESTVK